MRALRLTRSPASAGGSSAAAGAIIRCALRPESISRRISRCLRSRGASSLLSVAQACDHLTRGQCDVAIAGGAQIYSTPNMLISASRFGLLSPADRGCAFSTRATGMVPGESVGVVILKPLALALAEGDRIYGVIEAWGSNHNGKTHGIMAPSAGAQEALLTETYQRFDIRPERTLGAIRRCRRSACMWHGDFCSGGRWLLVVGRILGPSAGCQNLCIPIKVRIMYIMLNSMIGYAPGLALYIISHLTFNVIPLTSRFPARLTVTRSLLNAITHQSAYLDETASANLLFLSGSKSTNALYNTRRSPAHHAENFYTLAIRYLH